MGELIAYDPARVPRPYGLANTGVICYFNALLQGLATCTALVATVTANRDLMGQTRTGKAFYSYMRAVEESAKGGAAFRVDPAHSAQVLSALVQDVRARRPRFQFGTGMESASEGLALLLDMIEPPSAAAKPGADSEERVSHTEAIVTEGQQMHPVLALFHLRLRDRVWCRACQDAGEDHKGIVSHRVDRQYQFYYLHYDVCRNEKGAPISTPEEFSANLLKNLQYLEDYNCESCEKAGRPKRPPKGKIFRLYEVRRIPTILAVLFNQYTSHTQRYFPDEFLLDGASGKKLRYRLVSQIEHSGSLHGGHYWARAVRQPDSGAGPATQPFLLNDSSVSPAKLGPAPSVYTVLYHYVGAE